MIEKILNFATSANDILWGPWTMIFIASVSVYFTIRSGFFQVGNFGRILRNTIGTLFSGAKDRETSMMTPFQATATSLASTVGMGNIAGVATAITIGGPGAIFWMWLLAFLGMMTKTVEITLAVHYREGNKQDGLYGGPMYYIKKGLGWNFLGKWFSFGILINAVLAASLLQAHTVGRAFLKSYDFNPFIVAGLMTFVTALVVVGGVKRIGKICEKVVPLMSIVYLLAGLIIFIFNYAQIPSVFGEIFKYAFLPAPAIGGFAGAAIAQAIQQGMARGMLSNEAGLGTSPMVHAIADTKHPFQQGMWGAFEVFFDTIIICTITAFAILSTGTLSGGQTGIELVIDSFSSVFPADVANLLISFSILIFSLTSQIGFFVYYETAIVNLFGKKSMKFFLWFYFIPPVLFAGVTDVEQLWMFANIAVASCGIPNLIAILSLNGVFFTLMKDYLLDRNEYSTEKVDAEKNYVRSVS